MKPRLFIFIGGSDPQNGDYSWVHRLAKRGGSAYWSTLKNAQPGDRALIYIRAPHSALIAKAQVLGHPIKGEPGDYAYRVKTGRFALLPGQLTIRDLKREFPRWAWLRFPRRNGQVPDEYADRLWGLVHQKGVPEPPMVHPSHSGAGFGNAKTNRLVELAAVRKVWKHLRRQGYTIQSRENENLGYDLEAWKGRRKLHIEVKGISGKAFQFPITPNEVRCARSDPAFRLMAVIQARTRDARIREFRGRDLRRRFRLTALSYMATPV